MAAQNQSPDFLDQVFGSAALKGALALATFFGVLIKYLREAIERDSKSTTIVRRYHLGSPLFWVIVRLPAQLHLLLAFLALSLAMVEGLFLADQVLDQGRILARLPVGLAALLGLLSSAFVWIFVATFFAYITFELRLLERAFGRLLGLAPAWRQTSGWANAKWQIEADETQRNVLAPSACEIDVAADALVDSISTLVSNPSRALRPEGISDQTAANILFIGHVFEQWASKHCLRYYDWTDFYQALAYVAAEPDAPFAPATVRDWPGTTSYAAVLQRANQWLTHEQQIPSSTGLETTIEQARHLLARRFRGDATRIGDGLIRTSYALVLRRAAGFLDDVGMQRQFAKLFILWNVVPGAQRPAIFRIPFNSAMFIAYLDRGILRSEATRFDPNDERVQIGFEAAERRIVAQVFELLRQTRNPALVAARDAMRAQIDPRHIDWPWCIYYLADTQAYRDASAHVSETWRIGPGGEIVRKKT